MDSASIPRRGDASIDPQIDLLKADAEQIRRVWENFTATTKICGLWAHDDEHSGDHQRVAQTAKLLARDSSFFDTRVEHHRTFGRCARSASAVVILNDASFQKARHAADHYIDVHHLRMDIRPIIITVGDFSRNAELENYFRKLPMLGLPNSGHDTDSTWDALPLFLMKTIAESTFHRSKG